MSLQESLLAKYDKNLVCSAQTEIVIEGYPRSGNSFTCEMVHVLSENAGGIRMAHHTHNIMNVHLGAQLGKPILILLRKPAQAILSALLFEDFGIERVTQRYVNFYTEVLKMENVNIVPFETVVRDFEQVYKLVLQLTARDLPIPTDWNATIQLAKSQERDRAKVIHGDAYHNRVAVPDEARDRIKREKRPEVREFLTTTELGQSAIQVYRQCLAKAVLQIPEDA